MSLPKKRVRGLKIREIAYTRLGAGTDVPISIWKSLEEVPVPLTKQRLTELATITKQVVLISNLKKEGIDIGAKLDEILSKLSDEERAIVEMALAAAQGNAAPPPAPAPEPPPEGDMAKQLQKERDERAALQKKLDDQGKQIASLAAINKRREFITKAASLPYVPGDDSLKVDILEKMAEDPAFYPKFCEWIDGINEVIEKSEILGEVGSTGGGSDKAPLAQIEALAKQLRDNDPKMTYEVAFTKACELRQDLYKQLE